jgi:hypothetical protein
MIVYAATLTRQAEPDEFLLGVLVELEDGGDMFL